MLIDPLKIRDCIWEQAPGSWQRKVASDTAGGKEAVAATILRCLLAIKVSDALRLPQYRVTTLEALKLCEDEPKASSGSEPRNGSLLGDSPFATMIQSWIATRLNTRSAAT
jgi:hypothetical protein